MSVKISDAVSTVEAARANIIKLFEETMPENPGITRINDQCFTVSSKELMGKPWSPKYHGFRHSREIIEMIKKCPIENLPARLYKIWKDGSYDGVPIHPDQLRRIGEIYNEVL